MMVTSPEAPKIGPDWTMSREKRRMDLRGAAALAPFFAPVIAAAIPTIAVLDGMSPFFVQTRMGQDFEPFQMFKLRTMPVSTPETPSVGGGNDKRRTPLGSYLAGFHIDELPQLYNVFRGEMSLVGFRPGIHQEIVDTMDSLDVREQEDWQAAIKFMRPGMVDRYQLQLHRADYGEHTLRARALDTIEYAHMATHALDAEIVRNALRLTLEDFGLVQRPVTVGL